MKNRISFALFLLLVCLQSSAQIGGDYNPDNPSDPNSPVLKYTLSLTATPDNGGSFNITSTKVSVGERYNLRAYPNSDFAFVAWLCDGDTLSKAASYDYTMPSHNVNITGVFTYRPSSPSDPEEQALKYQLSLTAVPMNSGSFNISNERIAVGSTNSLRAYTNTDYVFKCWMIGDSVLSESPNISYVMPSHNVQMVGLFEYNPTSPGNPSSNYWNKETGEVIVDDFKTGNLSSAVSTVINGNNRNDVTMITVAGVMNSNDFGIVNNYTNCSLLDLSRVTGITEIPSYAFDYTNLESVYLPASIEIIGYHAFYECQQLLSLTLYAMTPPTLDRNVFSGVPEGLVVYVPAAAIPQYQETDGWKDFTILPIQEDIRKISVSLPNGTNTADFAQMWLELTNTKSGQRMHYVLTDRSTYIFQNIIRNTSWNIVLRNERGDIFGQIDDVEVKDEDISVSFTQLSKPQNLEISVLTPDGKDVTDQIQITWVDVDGNYLSQSSKLSGLPVGFTSSYRVSLSQELAMLYDTPSVGTYTLKNGNNQVICRLAKIANVSLSGTVMDATTNMPLSGATISASQTFGGKYSKTVNTTADSNGQYSLTLPNVPTTLAIASSDYVSQTLVCDSLMQGSTSVNVPTISLKEISGAVLSIGFTYTTCPTGNDDEDDIQEWYSDYNNISYSIYNKTKRRNVSQFNVQYPQIVLLETVDDGDVLELTATSRVSAFMPVITSTTVRNQRADIVFNIVELGKIQASFSKNGNASVVGSLYDENGKLIKTYNYTNAKLTIEDLADGNYTLVTMGSSTFFNTIYDLAQLPQTGLSRGVDYVQSSVEVKSGNICSIDLAEVPTLNENKLYYTGDNTSFTVNKTSIVAGNYLTLTGHLDFKSAYATSVSNVQLVVDLPESCSFVENSVMVGNSTSSYALNGNRLTIPMARYTDRVRFCVIPTLGGDYAPSALAQFNLNGKTITQPIGAANFNVQNIAIITPSITMYENIIVQGVARPKSDIMVYDNNILIGKTQSLANGLWNVSCNLLKPYNASFHNIYASTIKDDISIETETQIVEFDKKSSDVKSVKLLYRSKAIVFDFQNNTTSDNTYSYVPGDSKFTFLIDFMQNDSSKIKNVVLEVLLSDNTCDYLESRYDSIHNCWLSVGEYNDSRSIPINCNVLYEFLPETVDETERNDLQYSILTNFLNGLNDTIDNNYSSQLIKDEDNLLLFNLENPSTKDVYNIEVSSLNPSYFTNDNLIIFNYDEGSFMYNDSITDSSYYLNIVESDFNHAWQIKMSPNIKMKHKINSTQIPDELLVDMGGVPEDYLWLKILPIPFLDYLNEVWNGYNYWKKRLPKDLEHLNELDKEVFPLILAKCPDGSFRLDEKSREKFYNRLQSTQLLSSNFANNGFSMLEEWRKGLIKSFAFESAFLGIGKLAKIIPNIKVFYKSPKGGGAWGYLIKGGKKNRLFWEKFIENGINFGIELNDVLDDLLGDNMMQKFGIWEPHTQADIIKCYLKLMEDIKNSYKNCNQKPPKPEKKKKKNRTPNLKPSIDPSGFIYEGVFSNRLEGVTATAYYKETVEDMYGDLHDEVVKWDAAEYAQENPLFTDEYGYYRWDVPQGLWQVKFEKEGYETTYSEWLPVPPPQLDINIAMKQNVQPNVKNARAYGDAVEVEFDKYMMPEYLTTDNIVVMCNNDVVAGTVVLLNEEVSYEGASETFASKVRFNAAEPFDAKEVTLIVNNQVRSYAGIRMQDNFSQTFDVELEAKEIVCDANTILTYGENGTLAVRVLPASAAAGKTLYVKTSSPMILGVDEESVTLDNQGQAIITMTGNLPGTAALTFSLEGYDLSATTIVNIEQKSAMTVANPSSNIASGSIVERGTAIYLSCETEGATIYYTLDGSCPCDESSSRKIWDGTPIIINDNVNIKVWAIAPDMYESDVIILRYVVEGGNAIDDIALNGKINIYPLPVRDKLTISTEDNLIKQVTLNNVNGSTLIENHDMAKSITLDVSHLSTGIYIINIVIDDKLYSKKIIKTM